MVRILLLFFSVALAATAYAQTDTESVDGTGIESVDGTGLQSVDGTGMQARRAGSQYTVVAGDTLGKIAIRFYGDASQWRRLYDANRGTLADADHLPVGTVLTIPSS